MSKIINVLDHGKVELLDWMGDDLAVVQAAQSSFANFSDLYGLREAGILRSLMREEHGVPFEHVVLKWRLDMPISVARQLVKHRTSSWSEKSARYSKMDVVFYTPELADVKNNVGKPMLYTFEAADTADAVEFLERLDKMYQMAEENYAWAEGKIAREQARYFLPITTYTTVTWTMNVRSFLNVLHLRTDSHAQAETREYAQAMETLADTVIVDTLRAFTESGRVAP